MPRPTLLTHTSTRPNARIASSRTRSTSARLVRSASTARASPDAFATAESSAARRAASPPCAPRAPHSFASAAPMPALAPVTTIVLPFMCASLPFVMDGAALTPEMIEKFRSIGLRLDRNGRFWHEGVEVTHPRLRQALLRWLDVRDDGRDIVRLDAQRYAYIDVEDAHLRAV